MATKTEFIVTADELEVFDIIRNTENTESVYRVDRADVHPHAVLVAGERLANGDTVGLTFNHKDEIRVWR